MEQVVLARYYHEIALKKGNRPWFLKRMAANLDLALAGAGVGKIQRGPMMAMIPLRDESQWPVIRERLEHLIGIERLGRAYRVEPSLDAIKEVLPTILEGHSARSFRIDTHRSDKSFPMMSPEVNRDLGAFVQGLTGLPVDLRHADLTVGVQLVRRSALVSLEHAAGQGGMPVGVGGPVAVMLSGGIDSPVASHMMMKRGCTALFIHFHAFPLVDATSREKAQDLVRLLTQYQFRSRLLQVPFGQVQQQIIVSTPPAYRVLLYRRFMVRIAQELAARNGARALITGESLGQVSSQTLENIAVIDTAADRLPILRPLVGMDKEEIVARARVLGTYPISILPDQDCCTLFVPKHPVTRGRLGDVERIESDLPVDRLVAEAVEAAEAEEYRWPVASSPVRVGA